VSDANVRSAEVEVACRDLAATIDAFVAIGFRLVTILPADDPTAALIEGHGVRLRLVKGEPRAPVLRIVCHDPSALSTLAGEISVDLATEPRAPPLEAYSPEFLVTRATGGFHLGRAGMGYRDLIPGRLGGRVVASHIRIEAGGPVPDYVHFHAIRFQMIFCVKGWVRLVYEDQGDPFVLEAGAGVLQPPEIRHRVLECSPGLEVVEIGSPAIHATSVEHVILLPTPNRRPNRLFGGQRFVRSQVTDATRFRAGPTGIGAATGGIADAVVRTDADASDTHDDELSFGFVLRGSMSVACEGRTEVVSTSDAFVLPPRRPFSLRAPTADLAWLHFTAARLDG
jgi:quercetin dioxygenase-like cupin family protein